MGAVLWMEIKFFMATRDLLVIWRFFECFLVIFLDTLLHLIIEDLPPFGNSCFVHLFASAYSDAYKFLVICLIPRRLYNRSGFQNVHPFEHRIPGKKLKITVPMTSPFHRNFSAETHICRRHKISMKLGHHSTSQKPKKEKN